MFLTKPHQMAAEDKPTGTFVPAKFCSNCISGAYLRDIIKRVMKHDYNILLPEFGPGASDAMLYRDEKHPAYCTRDGLECLMSVQYDDEDCSVASQIHLLIVQILYNQARVAGDGTTTAGIFTYHVYDLIQRSIHPIWNYPLDSIRKRWKMAVNEVIDYMTLHFVNKQVTDSEMANLFRTCTKDDAIVEQLIPLIPDIRDGAFIYPIQSPIDTELSVERQDRTTLKVTVQYHMDGKADGIIENACCYYCAGTLFINHWEVLYELLAHRSAAGPANIFLICHGISRETRAAISQLKTNIAGWREKQGDIIPGHPIINNLYIVTVDNFREFEDQDINDLGVIITGIPGRGSDINENTFEEYLHRMMIEDGIFDIPNFAKFDGSVDVDSRFADNFDDRYSVIFNSGTLTLYKELPPLAKERLAQLKEEIIEADDIRKIHLKKRIKRTFGCFIEIKVGSAVLSDGQRRYELVKDALQSGTVAAESGIIRGNSLLYLMYTIKYLLPGEIRQKEDIWTSDNPHINEMYPYAEILRVLYYAAQVTIEDMLYTWDPSNVNETLSIVLERLDEWKDIDKFYLSDEALGKPEKIWRDASEVDNDHIVLEPFATIRGILDGSIKGAEFSKLKLVTTSNFNAGNWV